MLNNAAARPQPEFSSAQRPAERAGYRRGRFTPLDERELQRNARLR